MTVFEKELRKIVEPTYPDATFVGRACYVRLSEMNRAKIQFITNGIASHYESLRVTILNKQDGDVDNLVLRFSDILGKKMVNNPNFRDGVSPHLWEYNGKLEWYAYHPTSQDYQKLSTAVNDYLDVFQEQVQTASTQPQWSQTMQ